MANDADNVVILRCKTKLDLPPERILSAAIEAQLEEVVIVGTDKNGDLYFAGSMADGPTAMWLMELAKRALMDAPLSD